MAIVAFLALGYALWRGATPDRTAGSVLAESLLSLAVPPPVTVPAHTPSVPTLQVAQLSPTPAPPTRTSTVTPAATRTATATRTPTASPVPTKTLAPTGARAPLSYDTLATLTLEDIFPARDLTGLGLDPSRVRVLVATGDVIPARHVDVVIRQRQDDYSFPLAATKNILSAADLTVVNLESPLIEKCPPHDSGFLFCGRPGFAKALRGAGVDVATLENNHIWNYLDAGIAETHQHLEDNQIAWADRSHPAILDVRGVKFGFLAFNGVGLNFDRKAIPARIRELRPQVDVLAVAFHWGAEYEALPKTTAGVANDNPIEIAHLAIDAGADLIIGNHPHWVQAVEIYKGKFIAYAHGNFIFDQMWSYETRVGVVGRYTYFDRDLVKVEFLPVLSEYYAQPVPMKGAEAQAVLTKMQQDSRQLAQQLATKK